MALAFKSNYKCVFVGLHQLRNASQNTAVSIDLTEITIKVLQYIDAINKIGIYDKYVL